MFYIQVLETKWTKASRGGAGAQSRNALPTNMASQIPTDAKMRGNALAVQEHFSWSEPFHTAECSHAFIDREQETPFFKHENGFGFLQFEFSEEHCGAVAKQQSNLEKRDYDLKKSIAIPLGSWVQIIANGRFSDFDEGQWFYKQWILNAIQLDQAEIHDNPFLRYPLLTSFDSRRQLR